MPKSKETVEIPMAALLVEQKGKILLRKRPAEEKWLTGMWEFPSAEGKTFEEALQKLEKSLKLKAHRRELREVRHQITHHKIQLRLFKGGAPKTAGIPTNFQWVKPESLVNFPFSSAQDKLRDWVLQNQTSSRRPSGKTKTSGKSLL